MKSLMDTTEEAEFDAAIMAINRLLPQGFEATMAISKMFPRGTLPKGRQGKIVAEAAAEFAEATILPITLIPKQRGVRGLLCVEGPLNSFYTIDATYPSTADTRLLVAWLIVSGNLSIEKAREAASKMQRS